MDSTHESGVLAGVACRDVFCSMVELLARVEVLFRRVGDDWEFVELVHHFRLRRRIRVQLANPSNLLGGTKQVIARLR